MLNDDVDLPHSPVQACLLEHRSCNDRTNQSRNHHAEPDPSNSYLFRLQVEMKSQKSGFYYFGRKTTKCRNPSLLSGGKAV